MKLLSVCGISGSGKTTTIEHIIAELTKRGYRVGSVKEIHFEAFEIDPDPKSNTHRHRKAGARLVCARGLNETDLLFPEKLPMEKILSFYEGDYDWVIMEGVTDIPVPTIVTASTAEAVKERLNDMVFCISGRLSSEIHEEIKVGSFSGVPVVNATTDITRLVDLIEKKVYKCLPNFPPECCTACGFTCETLGAAILAGKATRESCIADKNIELFCDGKQINMVPFVQKILKNAVLGIVGELDGYKEGDKIEIRF